MSLKRQLARLGKPKFRESAAVMPRPRRILDIGIANDSYLECKAVFPDAAYDGVDLSNPRISMAPNDRFILCNLDDADALGKLPGGYDLIIINHVLEHLRHGQRVFGGLCQHLAPGGVLYAEFPSLRTAYVRKTRNRYHFHDDPTHLRFYTLEDLANTAMDAGCQVLSCGPISTPLKNALSAPRAVAGWLRGQGWGPYLLHLQGKIEHVMVQAKSGA